MGKKNKKANTYNVSIINKYILLLRKNKFILFIFFTLIIIFDVITVERNSDIILFSMLALYIAGIVILKLSSRYLFFLCLILALIMTAGYILSGTSIPTEKAAVWLFLFLGIGIIQQWRE